MNKKKVKKKISEMKSFLSYLWQDFVAYYRNIGKIDIPEFKEDEDAITKAVMYILNNCVNKRVSRKIANIIVIFNMHNRIYDKELLRQELKGICNHQFNEDQINDLNRYILIVKFSAVMFDKRPSEIRRVGDNWEIVH